MAVSIVEGIVPPVSVQKKITATDSKNGVAF